MKKFKVGDKAFYKGGQDYAKWRGACIIVDFSDDCRGRLYMIRRDGQPFDDKHTVWNVRPEYLAATLEDYLRAVILEAAGVTT